MNRIQLLSVLLLTSFGVCQAQNKTKDYYWYKGKQVEVTVNHNNLMVYYMNPSETEDHLKRTYGMVPEGVPESDYDYDKEIYFNIFSFDSNQYDFIYQSITDAINF